MIGSKKRNWLRCVLAMMSTAVFLTSCSVGSDKKDPAADPQSSAEENAVSKEAQSGEAAGDPSREEEQSGETAGDPSQKETDVGSGQQPEKNPDFQWSLAQAASLGTPGGRLSESLDLSDYGIAYLGEGGYYHDFSGEETEQLKLFLGKLVRIETEEIHIYRDFEGWNLGLSVDYEAFQKKIEERYEGLDLDHMSYAEIQEIIPPEELEALQRELDSLQPIVFTMAFSSAGYCMLGRDGDCYQLTQEFLKFLEQYLDVSEQAFEKAIFSVPYSKEPVTEEECRDAAVYGITKWLEECGKGSAGEEYRNRGFTIAEDRKNNFVAGGFLDGRREFLAEVCCSVQYDEDNDFYRAHEIARYTLAGTFWEGVYFCARFAWEDGTLILLSTNGSSEGLNGFQTSEYRNFFEYARRSDLEQEIDDSFVYYMGVVVSRNLTVTENGKELNLDIYQMAPVEDRGDTVYGDPDFRTYRGDESYYGTGVYFTDYGTSTKKIEYPKDFRLTFDNYTDDGNPDYAILYDTDENGAYYAIESVQSDGRVFNHSGRAYEGGVYVAGCYEPSPRLQRTEAISYIGWDIDENGDYYPTGRGNYRISLPAVNMYSDRLYLPNSLKLYLPQETKVTCFVWNNTDRTVRTQAEYQIQYLKDGENWITIAEGKNEETYSILPRDYAEIGYDLNLIRERRDGVYRIVQNVGDNAGYGEFWLAGGNRDKNWKVDLVRGAIPEGSFSGEVSVQNIGVEPHRIPEMRLMKEDGTEIPVRFEFGSGNTLLNVSESVKLSFRCIGEELAAGNYYLLIGDGQKAPFEVKPRSECRDFLDIKAERQGQQVLLTLQNTGTEEIRLDLDSYLLSNPQIYQKTDGGYEPLYLIPEEAAEDIDCIEAGGSVQWKMENYIYQSFDDEMMKELYDMWSEYRDEMGEMWEEYHIPENATFEEFSGAIRARFAMQDNVPILVILQYTYGDLNMETRKKFE